MPFTWPSTCQDMMLSTEVAQRSPKYPADYEEIARVFSQLFWKTKKSVVLSGRACKEKMNGLILKYLENEKEALKRWAFPPVDVNAIPKSIFVTTANGKPQTFSSHLLFAINAMLNVSIVVSQTRTQTWTAQSRVQCTKH